MRRAPHDFGEREPLAGFPANPVRSSTQEAGGGLMLDLGNPEHVQYLRNGGFAASGGGAMEGAMRVAVAYRCVHILAGACGNLPIDLYRRVSEKVREPATGHPLRKVLQRPNDWQTSSEFRKMLTAHAVLKGNGYALKITSMGRVIALWPIKNPDRMEVTQNKDMTLSYAWSRDDGTRVTLEQGDVLHLRGLTLDGIKGVGVLSFARKALGLAIDAEDAAARMYKQGVIAGLVFSKSGSLGDEAFARLKTQLSDLGGVENARKALILEDDLKVDASLMSAEDLQFLQSREFARSDIGMFFGVPPHMYGDTVKSTSWGSGIEAQGTGFVTYTADDWFVMWEQCLERDCLTPAEIMGGHYVRLQRQALMRGDLKGRWESYKAGLQWGVWSPDEVRAMEDANPRTDGEGGQYYDPPNTAGGSPDKEPKDDE